MNANLFFQACAATPEMFIHLIPNTNDVKYIANLCLVNTAFRDFFFKTLEGRKIWLRTASNLTGYDGSKIIDVRVTDFQYQLKLLVCPWLSGMTEMLCEYPDVDNEYTRHIYVLNNSRLILETTGNSGEDDLPNIISFPSTPCKSLDEFKKFAIKLPKNFPCKKKFSLTDEVEDALHELMPVPESAVIARRSYYYIHRTVYAMLETSTEEDSLGFVNGGIYFMSMRNLQEPKLLRYFPMNLMDQLADNDMCSAPQRIWLTDVNSILYFGPSMEEKPKLVCDEPDSLMGRMMPAIWKAFKGDAHGALKFMKEDMGGMDINTKSLWAGRTMLHYAALGNHPDAIKILVDARADVEQVDNHSMTPLMMATAALCPSCVKMLCENGADPNTKDSQNESVILKLGDTEWDNDRADDMDEAITQVLDYLIDFKADINAVDCYGRSILFHKHVIHDCPLSQHMVHLKADPTIKDKWGRSLLTICLEKKEMHEMADYILDMMVKEYKLDINATDENGRTTLSHLVFGLTDHDVKYLIQELKADVTIKDIHGKTAYDRFHTEMMRTNDTRVSSKTIAQLLKGSGTSS